MNYNLISYFKTAFVHIISFFVKCIRAATNYRLGYYIRLEKLALIDFRHI